MKKLFKSLLIVFLLAIPLNAVERLNTFLLLPPSIQKQITIFENRKPIKPRKFYITPNLYGIFGEYLLEDKTEKCWWNKYKLTIHF